MSIERIEAGPRMSQAVVHGNMVYLAGVVADERANASAAEQTAQILARIDALLAKAGSDKSRLLTRSTRCGTSGCCPARRRPAPAWKRAWRRPTFSSKSRSLHRASRPRARAPKGCLSWH